MFTLQKALEALEASQKKAQELGVAVSTAIVDSSGELVAFSKMDDAINISPRFSKAKAYTAATVGSATGDLAAYAGEGKPYYGVNTVLGGDLTIVAGGIPVKENGKIVGAVGVGGSMDVNQDVACAKAAVSLLEQ